MSNGFKSEKPRSVAICMLAVGLPSRNNWLTEVRLHSPSVDSGLGGKLGFGKFDRVLRVVQRGGQGGP